jgi:uncharacterized membrane protein
LILTDYPPQTQKITAELFVLPIILFFFVLAIGIFWLMPYMYVTFAKFYEDIKNNQVEIKDVPEVVAVPQA